MLKGQMSFRVRRLAFYNQYEVIDRCAKGQGIFLNTNRAEKFSKLLGDGRLEKESSRFAYY